MSKRKTKKAAPAAVVSTERPSQIAADKQVEVLNRFPDSFSPDSARAMMIAVLGIAYFITGARSVTFVDSGELLATAAELGVAHAPGTPLYTMLLSPFVNLLGAGGGTFFSALCALVASFLVFEIARLVKVRVWVAALAAMTFGLSRTIWFYASVTEVYTFHTVLALATLFFVLKTFYQPRRTTIILAGLFFGFSLCVHHLSAVLLAPGYLFLLFATAKKHQLKVVPTFVTLLASTAVGLLPYLYLIWAARRDGPFLWADTSTLSGLWFHISGKQYQSLAFSMPFDAVLSQLGFALGEIVFFFTPLALLPIFIGLYKLKNKSHELSSFAVFAFCGVAFNILYIVGYRMADDRDAYLLVSHLALLVPVLTGVQHLANRFQKPAVFAAVACLQLFSVNSVIKSDVNYAERYVQDVLAPVPSGGVLMTWDWNFSSPYLYKYTENYRHDVIVLDMHLLRKSVYIDRVLPSRYPAFAKQFAPELKHLSDLTKIFEQGQGTPKQEIIAAVKKLGHAIVRAYPRSTYATTNIDDDLSENTVYIPSGVTTKIVPQNDSISYVPEEKFDWEFWSKAVSAKDEVVRTKLLPAIAKNFVNRAHFEMLFNNKPKALERLELASTLFPTQPSVFFVKGQILGQLGDKTQASKAYAKALQLEPGNTLYLSAISNLK